MIAADSTNCHSANAPTAETSVDTRPRNGLMVLMVLKKIKDNKKRRPFGRLQIL